MSSLRSTILLNFFEELKSKYTGISCPNCNEEMKVAINYVQRFPNYTYEIYNVCSCGYKELRENGTVNYYSLYNSQRNIKIKQKKQKKSLYQKTLF